MKPANDNDFWLGMEQKWAQVWEGYDKLLKQAEQVSETIESTNEMLRGITLIPADEAYQWQPEEV